MEKSDVIKMFIQRPIKGEMTIIQGQKILNLNYAFKELAKDIYDNILPEQNRDELLGDLHILMESCTSSILGKNKKIVRARK